MHAFQSHSILSPPLNSPRHNALTVWKPLSVLLSGTCRVSNMNTTQTSCQEQRMSLCSFIHFYGHVEDWQSSCFACLILFVITMIHTTTICTHHQYRAPTFSFNKIRKAYTRWNLSGVKLGVKSAWIYILSVEVCYFTLFLPPLFFFGQLCWAARLSF